MGILPQIEETIPVSESPEMLDIVGDCDSNFGLYCRVFLPDNFYVPFSPLHESILEKIGERKERKKLAICATRGIGKTTLARAVAAKAICYADAKFIVYISNSSTSAEMQTENLKKDLLSPEIRRTFGDIRTMKDNMVEESWSKKSWVASTAGGSHYTFVLPRGSGQQVRGLLWKDPLGRNIRPDLIIFDDLEDTETIENEEQRRKRKEWFFADVMNCFGRMERMWSVVYIDTLKHSDALMQDLLEASDWMHVVASVCDDSYKSLAPNFMTDADVMAEVEMHREQGIMDVFAREFMCQAISKEDAAFRPEYFKYYKESDPEFMKELGDIINVVIIDPAKTVKMQSDETGFICWGINLRNNRLYLRYARGEKLHPDEVFDRGIELALRYNTRIIGIETTGSKEYIYHPFMNEIIRRGLNFEVIELNARKGQGKEFSGVGGGKKMRISSLVSYYRGGLIYHEESMTNQMESQLLAFPRGKRDDVIDAAAYITGMLDAGGRFFMPMDSDEEDPKSVEEEYADLENEGMLEYRGVCP